MVTIQYILNQWHEQLAVMGGTTIHLLNGLALVAVIFLPLEWLFSLRSKQILRRGFIRDLCYYFLNNLLPGMLVLVPMTLIVWMLHSFIPRGLHQWAAGLSLWSRYLASLIVAEIGTYWGHRLMHEIPYLWRFHAVHHSAEEMDWLVNTKAHPLDFVFTRACGFLPLYVLGLAQPLADHVDSVPFFVTLFTSLWGYFIHSNVRWRFGWIEWLITTPAFHHWHHTNDGPKVINKNYSALFPWVDKLFGSLYLPASHPEKYGIDEPMPENLARQLIHPFMTKPSHRSTYSPKQAEEELNSLS